MQIVKILTLGYLILFFSIELKGSEGFHIVTPSSLAPFSKFVISKIDKEERKDPPTIEIKNSEQAFKAFCSGGGLNTPDIVNSDRRIKKYEFNKCINNGVKNISEAIIGYDATVLIQNLSNKTFSISKEALILAILAKVPSEDGLL